MKEESALTFSDILYMWLFHVGKLKRNIAPFAKKAYLGYVQVKLGDQDKSWAPHKAYKTCVETLRSWIQGKKFSYNLEYQ